jgi:Transposase
VDRLLAAGHPVVRIHPNAFHAARPRWGGSRAKSDAGDAVKLAEFVRTELGAEQASVRLLVPTMPATVQLRTLCRTRGDLQMARLAAASQLDAVLAANWPGPCGLFDRLDCQIGLAFLDRYPTPDSAARLTVTRLEGFLAPQRLFGQETRRRAAGSASSRS